jgi:5-methylcytosine-specific restriction protein A
VTNRDDLRPKEKLLVMDILESMGMDVSKWADMKGGARRAASNPKYCYNWSFHQPGEFIVVCFWYDGLQQKGSRLLYELKRSLKGPKRTEPGTGSDNKKSQ